MFDIDFIVEARYNNGDHFAGRVTGSDQLCELLNGMSKKEFDLLTINITTEVTGV